MTARYALGIDLGTTNSVLAYAPLEEDEARVELLSVPQLVAAGTLESRPLLPSFLYLAAGQEARAGSLDVPWESHRDFAVGELARRQAAEMPQRTVVAAKSWLCYSRVDRHQPILPWNAPADVPKVSPVTASKRYLEHLVGAWEHAFPDAPVAEQYVVLTVPASFDAAARELTREAALAAGLPEHLLLLEEPQAAVYAWLAATGPRWRRLLSVGDKLLVCDVGGGTTDFTLIKARRGDGPVARRQFIPRVTFDVLARLELALAPANRARSGQRLRDADFVRDGVVGHLLPEAAVMMEEVVQVRTLVGLRFRKGDAQDALHDERTDDMFVDGQTRGPLVAQHRQHMVIVGCEGHCIVPL